MGNEHAVVQILVNLILNAIQASDGSPRLEIEIREAGSSAEIRVSDHGAGFDRKTIDQIFDPFFTTKHSRSGLGLSISFDLADDGAAASKRRIAPAEAQSSACSCLVADPGLSHDSRLVPV
jgi:two-component system sensor histidine kinase FlrB